MKKILVLLCLTLLPAAVHGAEKTVLRIGGTGGALGGIREAAAAYERKHRDVGFTIPASLGSSGGIKAVLFGALDIAVSSRLPNDEERQRGAVAEEYARTPFIFITSGGIPVRSLTFKQMAAIYSGEFPAWPDGTPVRLILRPKSDTDNVYLRSLSAAMDKAVPVALEREGMVTAVTDQDNADMIQRIRGAFGASTLAQIISEKRQVTIIPIEGRSPDVAALRNGAYPWYKSLYVITRSQPGGAARSFMDFLTSGEGHAILERTGHLPGPFAPSPAGSGVIR